MTQKEIDEITKRDPEFWETVQAYDKMHAGKDLTIREQELIERAWEDWPR